MTGTVADPDFINAASGTLLWGLYNPDAVNWVDRPDDVPNTNLVLAFEPE